MPNDTRPESYYHSIICQLADDILSAEQLEIVQVARQIQNPGDIHNFFNDIIERMDLGREIGLNKLVDLLSLTDEWSNIKSNIKQWLDEKRDVIIES